MRGALVIHLTLPRAFDARNRWCSVVIVVALLLARAHLPLTAASSLLVRSGGGVSLAAPLLLQGSDVGVTLSAHDASLAALDTQLVAQGAQLTAFESIAQQTAARVDADEKLTAA